jgi:hypothetical protein
LTLRDDVIRLGARVFTLREELRRAERDFEAVLVKMGMDSESPRRHTTSRILDTLQDGPKTSLQVIYLSGCHPKSVRPILSKLVRDGLLQRTPTGYALATWVAPK